ncbi:hypothetical protein M8J77_022115 [Diaphorina citri]|nr:hypothetical protein M8J77_022115 [Diaphorina citri]
MPSKSKFPSRNAKDQEASCHSSLFDEMRSILNFNLYINDISSCFTCCHFHLYADDLQVYLSSSVDDLTHTITTINLEIEQLVHWAKTNCLTINPQKTKVMLICSTGVRRSISFPIPNIEVDGNAVQLVDTAKNLGIIFDQSLCWVNEVSRILKRVFGSLWTLRRIKNFTTQNSRLLLIKSYVLPLFEYCSPLLFGITLEQATRLQRAQNSCLRFVYRAKRRDHVTPLYNRARLLRLEDRRKILTLCLLYKILATECPPYLYHKYEFRSSVRSRVTRSHELLLEVPSHNTTSYGTSFLISSINLWNSVPYPILNSLSVHSFKASLTEAVSEGLFSS